jgi:acyl-CoA dehydrogenase
MDFSILETQREVRDGVNKICAQFGDAYWRAKDKEGKFPHEFYRAIADGGWLGIAAPESFGGSGLGMTAALTMMQTAARP